MPRQASRGLKRGPSVAPPFHMRRPYRDCIPRITPADGLIARRNARVTAACSASRARPREPIHFPWEWPPPEHLCNARATPIWLATLTPFGAGGPVATAAVNVSAPPVLVEALAGRASNPSAVGESPWPHPPGRRVPPAGDAAGVLSRLRFDGALRIVVVRRSCTAGHPEATSGGCPPCGFFAPYLPASAQSPVDTVQVLGHPRTWPGGRPGPLPVLETLGCSSSEFRVSSTKRSAL